MGLFKELQEQFSKIQQQNRESQKERTAPREVFDRMRDRLEEIQTKNAERRANRKTTQTSATGGGIFAAIKEALEKNKRQNEASEVEETAEASIFDRMKAELERMEQQKHQYEEVVEEECCDEEPTASNPPTSDNPLEDIIDSWANKEAGTYHNEMEPLPTPKPNPIPTNSPTYEPPVVHPSSFQVGSMATADGNGGSLALRMNNHITASQNAQRVPHGAQVRILGQSDQNKINLDGQICGWYKVEYNGQIGWLLDTYLH